MAKRGRPRKTTELNQLSETDELIVNTEAAPAMFTDNSVSFSDDREAGYKEYDESVYGKAAAVDAEIEKELEIQTAGAAEKSAEAEAKPEISEEVQVKEEKASEEEKIDEGVKGSEQKPITEEKIKTVPLSALHESRSENKELKKRLKEIEARLNIPREDVDSDSELEGFVTRKDLSALEQKLANIEAVESKRSELENSRRLDANISKTDNMLKEEGIFGFAEIGKLVVVQRLQNMAAEDFDHANANDNPEGWAKIWKEEYPKYKKLFIADDMANVMKERKERKENAGLVQSAGIKTDKPDTVPQTTEEQRVEYMKMRQRTSIV